LDAANLQPVLPVQETRPARSGVPEHQRGNRGDSGIGKVPQGCVRPAVADFRSGSEDMDDFAAGILHGVVDEVDQRSGLDVRKSDFPPQMIGVGIGPAVDHDDFAAVRAVLQDGGERIFKLLAGAQARNHDGEPSHENPSMTGLGGREARGGSIDFGSRQQA
jgi:hypothetical protein